MGKKGLIVMFNVVNTVLIIIVEIGILINIVILLKRKPKMVKTKHIFYPTGVIIAIEYIGPIEAVISHHAPIEEILFYLFILAIPLLILLIQKAKSGDMYFINFNTRNLYDLISNILKEKDIFFDTIYDGDLKYKINIPEWDSTIKIFGTKESSALRVVGKNRKETLVYLQNIIREKIPKVENENISFKEILISIVLLVFFSWNIFR